MQDPLDSVNALLNDPLSRPRRRSRPRMTPEREQSLLAQTGSGVVSGLGAVGNLLDLPGSMVRDAVAFENPFDQLLSPLSDTNRTTGRDLNRQFGLAGKKDNWLNFGGGILTEAALDPLTYLTGGLSAMGKAGKVAKMAGLSDDIAKAGARAAGKTVGPRAARMNASLDDLLQVTGSEATEAASRAAQKMGTSLDALRNEKLGSLARFQVPFTDMGFGIGKAGNKVADTTAEVLDTLGMAAKASAPARFARQLFDPAAGGKYGALEQEVQSLAHRKLPGALSKAAYQYDRAMKSMDDGWQAFSSAVPQSDAEMLTRSVFDKIVRHTAERNADEAFDLFGAQGVRTNEVDQAVRSAADEMVQAKNAMANEIVSKGGSLELIDSDLLEHFPRFIDPRRTKGYPTRVLPTGFDSMKARFQEIRTLPTEIVNRLLSDSQIMGKDAPFTGEQAVAHIQNRFGNWLDDTFGRQVDEAGQVVNQGSARQHAEALADWIQGRSKRPLFTHQTAEDFFKAQKGSMRVNRSLDAIHEFLGANAGDQGVTLANAFKSIGLQENEALAHFAQARNISPQQAQAMRVPDDVVKAARGLLEIQTKPVWQQKIEDVVDAITDTFKGSVTVATAGRLPIPLFPAFFIRNLTSGQAVNFLSGDLPLKEIPAYVKAAKEAIDLIKEPDSDLLAEMSAWRVLDNKGFMDIDTGMQAGQKTPANPLNVKQTMAEVNDDLANLPPSKIPTPLRREFMAATKGGGKLNQWIEYLNRAPMYVYLRKKGYSPEAAAKEIHKLHFDYSDLSGFEQTYMKRLAPFYAFARKSAGLIADELTQKPGGRLAQLIRTTNRAQDSDQPVPEYVQKTTAIPISGTPLEALFGKPPEGNDRYLTGLGLAHEQPLAYFGFDPERPVRSMAQNAGYEFASQMNPLLKAPLENMTGQSFFQGGRELEDIDPGLGRAITNISDTITGEETYRAPFVGSPSLENILLNTPATRAITSTRQAFDPRKSALAKMANLGTGLRLHDVSPAAKETMTRERIDELIKMDGGRAFERTYLPDDVRATMSPEEQRQVDDLLDLLGILDQRQKQRARQRQAK